MDNSEEVLEAIERLIEAILETNDKLELIHAELTSMSSTLDSIDINTTTLSLDV